jgi:hypothetical protein
VSHVVVNGGRFVSHHAQTAPHKLFGPSAQNIGLRPISNAGFEKTPRLVVETSCQVFAGGGPPRDEQFVTKHSYYRGSDKRFVNRYGEC